MRRVIFLTMKQAKKKKKAFSPKCVLVACKLRLFTLRCRPGPPAAAVLPVLPPGRGRSVGRAGAGAQGGTWRGVWGGVEIDVEPGECSDLGRKSDMHVVVSCGLCVAPAHHHAVHTRRAVISVFQRIAAQVQNSPRRMEEGSSSSKHVRTVRIFSL